MAAILGRYTTVLIDRWDFSTQLNQANMQAQNGTIDVTPFETAGTVSIQEQPNAMLDIAGFFSGAGVGYLEKELHDRLDGANDVLTTALYGTHVAACPAYVFPSGNASGMVITAPAKNVITISGKMTTSAGAKHGKRIYNGTIVGTGAGDAVDFGAAGSDGGSAYLHVTVIGGTATNATIQVQSDSSGAFGAPALEGTFTFSSAAGYAIALTGAIGQYLRINTTSMGGATSFAVQVIACVKGVS